MCLYSGAYSRSFLGTPFTMVKHRFSTIYVILFFQAEKVDIEEKYANLKEEAAGKTKKLKKVWTMLMSAKSEVICDV